MQSMRLRRPTPDEGAALHNLVQRCPPLDQYSRCNLLQVSHIRDVSVVADQPDELRGFASSHRFPDREDELLESDAHSEDRHDETIPFRIGPFVADEVSPHLRESA